MNPGPIPIWLMLAVVGLFVVGRLVPAYDTACALFALGLVLGTFIPRTFRGSR